MNVNCINKFILYSLHNFNSYMIAFHKEETDDKYVLLLDTKCKMVTINSEINNAAYDFGLRLFEGTQYSSTSLC